MTAWHLISRIGTMAMPFLALSAWLLVFLQKLLLPRLRLAGQHKKKILLIAQNKIAADHIKIVWDLFKNDKQLNFSVTDDQLINRHFSKKELATIVDTQFIHIIPALLCPWDLIVFVNHPWGLGMWFAPSIKKVYINHGIYTGKINNDVGEDGVYGKSRVNRPFAKPLYVKMFAASEFEKKLALSFNDGLQSRIAVTGFLRADLIGELNQDHRSALRRKLGFRKDDIVIHIISTWGSQSLFQTMGEALLREAANLSARYKFMFSLHPRHDAFGDVKGRKRIDILEKYEKMGIMPAGELSWDENVVASDLAISDHSSLCLYYVLLNKPIILAPVDDGSYVKNSSFDQLKKILPRLDHPERLSDCIQAALRHRNHEQVRDFGLLIREYRGRAAERYKQEIYGILKDEN